MDIMTYLVVILAVLTGVAGVLHAVASILRARNPELAKKLEGYEHGIEALSQVLQKHEDGESIAQAAIETAESPQGQAVVQALLAKVQAPPPPPTGSGPSKLVIFFALGLGAAAAGCSSKTVREQGQVVRGADDLLSDDYTCSWIKDPEWQNRRALWLVQAAPFVAAARSDSLANQPKGK